MTSDLTTGSVPKRLFRFALPLLFANVLQSLYQLVDMLVVGRFLGSPGLAAVSSAAMLCYVITSLCSGAATGGSVLVAQRQGAGDPEGLRRVIGALFILSGLIALAVTALGLLTCGPILRAMHVPGEALSLAHGYLLVICGGTFFVLGYNAVCGVLRGLGDSVSPLLFVALATAVNVALDLLLVGALGLGTVGAALATVCSQAVSCLAALRFCFRRGLFSGLQPRHFLPGRALSIALLRIGLPTAVQLSVVNLSYLLVTGWFNLHGTAAAAAAGVGLKVNTFAAMPCWAVGMAVTTMAGQCMGAGNPDRAAGALCWGLRLSLALCAGTVALVQLFAGPIVALFDPNPAVVAAGVTYLRICCSVNFAFYAAMYLFDSLATGVGAAGLAMGNAMLHSVVMRLALSWWLGGALGFSGLCWAEMLAPIPSALLGLLWFRLGRWRQRGPL